MTEQDDLDVRYPEPDPGLYDIVSPEAATDLVRLRDWCRATKARIRAERAAAAARGEPEPPIDDRPPIDDLDVTYPEPDPDLYPWLFDPKGRMRAEVVEIRDRNRAIKDRIRAERAAAAAARGEHASS